MGGDDRTLNADDLSAGPCNLEDSFRNPLERTTIGEPKIQLLWNRAQAIARRGVDCGPQDENVIDVSGVVLRLEFVFYHNEPAQLTIRMPLPGTPHFDLVRLTLRNHALRAVSFLSQVGGIGLADS